MMTKARTHSLHFLQALSLFFLFLYFSYCVNGEGGGTSGESRAALSQICANRENAFLNIPLFSVLEDSNLCRPDSPEVGSFQKDSAIGGFNEKKDKEKREADPKEMDKAEDPETVIAVQDGRSSLSPNKKAEENELGTFETGNSQQDREGTANRASHGLEDTKKRGELDGAEHLHNETEPPKDVHRKTGSEVSSQQEKQLTIIETEISVSNDTHTEPEPQQTHQIGFNNASLENDSQKVLTTNATRLGYSDQDTGKSNTNLVQSKNIILNAVDEILTFSNELKRAVSNASEDLATNKPQPEETKAQQDALYLLDLVKAVGKEVHSLQLNFETEIEPNLGNMIDHSNTSLLDGEAARAVRDLVSSLENQNTSKTEYSMLGKQSDDTLVPTEGKYNDGNNLSNAFRDSVCKHPIRYYLTMKQRAVVEDLEAVAKDSGFQIDLCEPGYFISSMNSIRAACLFVGFYVLAVVLSSIRVYGVCWRRTSTYSTVDVRSSTFSNNAPGPEQFLSSSKVDSEDVSSNVLKPSNDSVMQSQKIEPSAQLQLNITGRTAPPSLAMPLSQPLLSVQGSRKVSAPPVPFAKAFAQSKSPNESIPSITHGHAPLPGPTKGGPPLPPIERLKEPAQPHGKVFGREFYEPGPSGMTASAPLPEPPRHRLAPSRRFLPVAQQNPNETPQQHPMHTAFAHPAPSGGGDEDEDDACELRNPFLSRWA